MAVPFIDQASDKQKVSAWRHNIQASVLRNTTECHIINSHVISDLQDRFAENPYHGVGLFYLLPAKCCSNNAVLEDDVPEVLLQAVDHYQNDLPML